MNNILILVSFGLILILNLCFAYMPVYHVANQDLLKGILLGALLTTQKHPPNFLNVMPMPMQYYNPQTSYGYSNPSPSTEHNINDMEYRDKQTDQHSVQHNPNHQQMSAQQQESESEYQSEEQATQPQAQQEQQHQRQQKQRQQLQQLQQEEEQQQQQQQQQPQQSESLYDPVVNDPPSPPSNPMPLPSGPVIPSMESIQRNLGFPGHNVILMILPALDDKITKDLDTKVSNKTEPTTEQTEQTESEPEQHSSEQQLISNYDNQIKTNAIKIGTKLLNPKGWKPVPKSATTTTTPPPLITTLSPESSLIEFNNRLNRYNINRYIERSQFGARNRDYLD